MKFGKHIQSNVELGWANYYMSYKELKKIINSVANKSASDNERAELRISFFARVENELEKVSSFYVAKESDLKARLKSLEDKMKVLKRNSRMQSKNAIFALNQAYEYFQRDLAKLQRYVDVNSTGFRKILKKYDKKTKENTKELFLSTQYRIQPFFDAQSLSRMSDAAMMNSIEVGNAMLNIEDQQQKDYAGGSGEENFGVWDENLSNIENLIAVNDHEQLAIALQRNSQTLSVNVLMGLLNHSFDYQHHRGSGAGSLECARVLFDSFSHILAKASDEYNNRSVLHEACIFSSVPYLELGLEFGVAVDTQDSYGRMPIHYASQNGFVEGVQILLSHGSTASHIDHDGYSPLIYAIVNGHVNVVLCLLGKSANTSESLIGNIVNNLSAGQNCITLACEHGHLDVVKCLLDRQVSMEPDEAGFYPLHISCRKGYLDISALLLDRGHDIDICDKYHIWSSVFHAASQGHYECVKLLVERGCNVSLADENGWLPAVHAVYRGHLKTAALLDPKFSDCLSSERGDKLNHDRFFKSPYFVSFNSYEGSLKSISSEPEEKKSSQEIETLPELVLPPPIITPQIYGHASIPDDQYQICIMLGHLKSEGLKPPISFNVGLDVSSMKMKLSVTPKKGFANLPHNILLPCEEGAIYTFTLPATETNPSVLFDLYSTFGTKIHARASFTFDTSAAIRNDHIYESSTLYDQRLRIIGKVFFQIILVKPYKPRFAGLGHDYKSSKEPPVSSHLTAASTSNSNKMPAYYWKSCKPASPNSSEILIETSLDNQRFLAIPINFTHDGVPLVVFPPTTDINKQTVPIHALNYRLVPAYSSSQAAKLQSCATIDDIFSILTSKSQPFCMKLDQFLMSFSKGFPFILQLNYEKYENDIVRWSFSRNALANIVIDIIMHIHSINGGGGGFVGNNSNHTFVLSSFDPDLCTILHAKQSSIPVLFTTCAGENPMLQDKRCLSLQEAVNFSKNCNFLGLISLINSNVMKQKEIFNTLGTSGLLIGTL